MNDIKFYSTMQNGLISFIKPVFIDFFIKGCKIERVDLTSILDIRILSFYLTHYVLQALK